MALKAEFFDEIRAGTKTEEFRLDNDYWRRRLFVAGSNQEPRLFAGITLTKGYPKRGDTERTIRLPWRGWTRKTILHPHFGDAPVKVFAIVVG